MCSSDPTPRPFRRAITRAASVRCLALLLSLPAALASQAPIAAPVAASSATPPAARGFVVGTVIDKESGRPLEAANIILVNTQLRTATDLDGKFRIAAPAGTYSVRAFRLGSAPAQIESVRVVAGATVNATFALGSVAVTLGAVAVTAGPARANNEDALLAMQKAAPRVSDGISAQAIARAPGSSAGDAILRVTGVSIVDNKFAVVRGLAERYSNTLLNGVELPSPEPLKKIVPLDLFPSSLLESIVVSKTATPDRPGDFAGGSVEISTKEFPDQRVMEGNLSLGYGSQSSLRNLPHVRLRGVDYLGFDQGGVRQMPREVPTIAASTSYAPANERFAEQLRNVWAPSATRTDPNFGGSLNFGGRIGERMPLGYAISASLNRQMDATPNRLQQLVFDAFSGVPDQGYVSEETTSNVDLGAIANFAMRFGTTQKIGWKNLFTRSAEERLSRTAGYETAAGNAERLIFQSRYITRTLEQTQLTGDHLLPFLLRSRLEWRLTAANAIRDEPENRSLQYFKGPTESAPALSPSSPSQFWFRFLDDRVRAGQADLSIPIPGLPDGTQVKTGFLYRERDRLFDAYFFRVFPTTDPLLRSTLTLPPEQVFSPELVGVAVDVRRQGAFTAPYEADDDVKAAYAMVDVPITGWLRFVGGVRREDWKLNLYNGTKLAPLLEPTIRRTQDVLPSGNLTISLSDRQNLRLAVYGTVARPDPREVSSDYYTAIAGDCGNQGNPQLQRSRIMNGDVRWELFPNPGELISVSAFYKDFTDPIGEVLSFEGSSLCTTQYRNFESARILGSEFELRKSLAFLGEALARFAIGVNVTLVQSETVYRIDSTFSQTFRLQGQSDRLANLNVLYTDDARGLDMSLLLNYFSDRIQRYGIANIAGGELSSVPGVVERGRLSLDTKLRQRVGRTTISLSGRNLTDNEIVFFQPHAQGITRTGYVRPGITVSLGVGYAIR